MLSPARARLRMDSVSAAWPDARPSAATPPSSAATRSSKTAGRRVHDPGVDVPELLEAEEPGGVRRVVEDVAGRGVDRHGPGVRGRVRLLAGVQRPGLGSEGGRVEFCHVVGSSVDGWGSAQWIEARRPWAGRWVRRSPVVSFGGTKKPQLRRGVCSPGTSSVGPALPWSGARDVRPHPPHGGAACAYTCSGSGVGSHGSRMVPDPATFVNGRSRIATLAGRPSG